MIPSYRNFVDGLNTPSNLVNAAWLNAVDRFYQDVQDPADPTHGDFLVAVKRSDMSGAADTTQDQVNKALPYLLEAFCGLTLGAGLTQAQRQANYTAIKNAIAAAKAAKCCVFLPKGIVQFEPTGGADLRLKGANGVNVIGHGNLGEMTGLNFAGTTLQPFAFNQGTGSEVSLDYGLDLLGSGASVDDRIQCCWSNFVLDCQFSGTTARGIRFGWNMRSMDLLKNVTVLNTAGHGVAAVDQNWNVSFTNLRCDNCGTVVANSSGFWKDPAVDGGTWNYIIFINCQFEGCGSSSSTAGGFNCQTTTSALNLTLINCIFELNGGTDEAYISNVRGLCIDNAYIERTNVVGRACGMELSGCTGKVVGGYVTCEAGAPLQGIFLRNGCDINVIGVETSPNWSTGGIVNSSSKVYTLRNVATYANGDASAQWFGDYSPRLSVHRNGVVQSIPGGGAPTKVVYTTERYDYTACHTSGTVTPIAVATYQVDAGVRFDSPTGGDSATIAIYVNGGVYKQVNKTFVNTQPETLTIAAQIDTNAVSDTIEIYVSQSNAGAKDINGAASTTWLMVSQIGRFQ